MRKFNARSCVIKNISKDLYKEFCLVNHRQGYAAASVIYGLYTKDTNELLQLMSFGAPRFNKHFEYELVRECSKKDCMIRGGTSKLWKHFICNNTVYSCLCYSYPHDLKTLYTDHYEKYCGFKNITKAAPERKLWYVGEWEGRERRFSSTILARHGVDRLLKTVQGQDRTNDQIMLDLGFKKVYEDGYTPQFDAYYPEVVVYKVTDMNTGKYFIGLNYVHDIVDKKDFLGDGKDWKNYLKENPDHVYKKEILKDDFVSPDRAHQYILNKLHKECHREGKRWIKNDDALFMNCNDICEENEICFECNGIRGKHRNQCSMYQKIKHFNMKTALLITAIRDILKKYNRPLTYIAGSRLKGHPKNADDFDICIQSSEYDSIKKDLEKIDSPFVLDVKQLDMSKVTSDHYRI